MDYHIYFQQLLKIIINFKTNNKINCSHYSLLVEHYVYRNSGKAKCLHTIYVFVYV